jgi:hypothetical protein
VSDYILGLMEPGADAASQREPRPSATRRVASAVARHPVVALLALYPLFLAAGFALTRIGTSNWDTPAHYYHQLWLMGKWRGEELPVSFETIKWRGPLWEYVLAGACAALSFLHDDLWVRHAVTFTALPLTLIATFVLLRRAGEASGTALLAVALVAGNVRFLGHSLVNEKDFPFVCAYLLVTLAMATAFIRRFRTPAGLFAHPGTLAGVVLASVVPYLLRVPVLPHWLLLVGVCTWAAAFTAGSATVGRRLTVAALPLLLGPLAVFAVSPVLWDRGPLAALRAARYYAHSPWRGPVRLFGRQFVSSDLPWWYGPAWIPVSWVPLGLLVLLAGGLLFFPNVVKEIRRLRPWPLPPLFGSLAVWVALFAAAPWAAVLLVHPTLYDEDRHLLFAMPLLGVSAALGLRGLKERTKDALAALVLVTALWSAVSWGRYAYVYKDRLLPRTAGDDFMGDYWGVSSGALAQALYDHVPDHGYVYVMGPRDTIAHEIGRRKRSRGVRAREARSFDLRQRARRRGDMYVAAINRNGACRPLLDDVARGRARELWRAAMPGGDVAALLVYYAHRCDDCPRRLREHVRGGVD